MLDDLLEAIRPREKPVTLGARALVARELGCDADTSAMVDNQDLTWKLVVRCVFDAASGEPAFTDKDIPALKRGAKLRLKPVVDAVMEVNGASLEAEEKNSAAAPDSGSSTA